MLCFDLIRLENKLDQRCLESSARMLVTCHLGMKLRRVEEEGFTRGRSGRRFNSFNVHSHAPVFNLLVKPPTSLSPQSQMESFITPLQKLLFLRRGIGLSSQKPPLHPTVLHTRIIRLSLTISDGSQRRQKPLYLGGNI